MFEDDREGFRSRLTFTGEMGLHLPDGDVKLTRVEVRCGGTFGAPEAPFKLTLEAPHDELRKLGSVSPSLGAILALDPDAEGDGVLVLVARAEQLAALQQAASGTPELEAEAMVQNTAWLAQLFTLEGYEAESMGTVERRIE